MERVVISNWNKRPQGGNRPTCKDSIHPGYLYQLSPNQRLVEVVDKDNGTSVTKHVVVGL